MSQATPEKPDPARKDDPARFSVENFERPVLETPNGADRILMHSCCAPCAAEIMDALAASEIETTIFFYNPNIHPRVNSGRPLRDGIHGAIQIKIGRK